MAKRNSFTLPHSFGDLDRVPSAVIDDFFGIWSIEETRFRQAVDRYQGFDLVAHIAANRGQINHLVVAADSGVKAAAGDRRLYDVQGDGIAVVKLRGPMMKYASSMSGGASTVFARRQIRQAVNDDAVRGILLVTDTPGGTVAGTMDLAEEIAKAKVKKPVHAFIEDLTASAGIWVVSQATKVFANNATALVGSIGTYAVLFDMSEAAEKVGVKVHVVKAGEFKGAGVPGTAITDEQLANTQRIVDSLNSEFLNGVAKGRNLSLETVKGIADGRIHPAAEAVGLKLVDGVQSYDETIAGLARETSKRRSFSMSTEHENAATLEELKAQMPEAGAEFLISQLERNATIGQALNAFNAKMKADNEALRKQLADNEAKHKEELEQAKTAKEKVGVEPLETNSTAIGDSDGYVGATGDPVSDFDTAVRERMKVNPQLGRQRCAMAVARANPALHQAFLLATNSGRKAQRLLVEKYEDEAAVAS